MSATLRIAPKALAAYCDAFTRRFLLASSPEAVVVEVREPDWRGYLGPPARLLGLSYDPAADELEFELDSGSHALQRPEEVWALEEPDGFLRAVEVRHPDGSREVVTVVRLGRPPQA
jgi:hypothetical protein